MRTKETGTFRLLTGETRKTELFLLVYFTVYLVITLYQLDFWGNLVSPVGGLAAALILWLTFRRAQSPRLIWLFFSLACLSWAVSDILWALCQMALHRDPGEEALLMYSYLLPNLFLMVGTASYLLPRMRRWNWLQLFLDLTTLLTAVLSVIWIVFFNRQFSLILSLDATGITTFAYVVTDFVVIGFLFILFTSSPRTYRNRTFRLITVGLLLYSAVDLSYCLQVFNDSYIPNSLTDGVYMAALLSLAWAAIGERREPLEPVPEERNQIPANYGSSSRVLVLLLIPPLFIAVKGFVLGEFLFAVVIIAGHQTLSGIVQRSILNAHLLEREKEVREQLEQRISERTRELVQANRDLDYLSRTDIVTGLNNRWFFMKEVERTMRLNGRSVPIALFYMDLDRFKAVNDSYGHQTGDSVLVAIAGRLQTVKKSDMLLARLGGDEFVIAVFSLIDRAALEEIACRLVTYCSSPVSIPPYHIQLGVSIGIALYPDDAQDSQTLFRYADIAMYEAKKQSDSRYTFYSADIHNVIQHRHRIEMLLHDADIANEFTLHYQPQFEADTGALVGMESLIRWSSTEMGNLMPGEFIPIAEETGSIIPLSEWVMKAAVRRITDWNTRFGTNLRIGINISPTHVCSIHFLEFLEKQISECGARPEWLDIEVTENSAMNNAPAIEQTMKTLRKMGISISIDDFGTGYTSISYITRFEIPRLKIAKELIDTIASDESSIQIVRAIITMAGSMGIRTIAEGVELPEQREALVRLGCDEIQGFLMGRPVPAEEFEQSWLVPIEPVKPIRR